MEKINHPSYYLKDGKECIDAMEEKYGTYPVLCFCNCNAFKYRWRAGLKPHEEAETDINKAEWYEAKANRLRKKLAEGGSPCSSHNV